MKHECPYCNRVFSDMQEKKLIETCISFNERYPKGEVSIQELKTTPVFDNNIRNLVVLFNCYKGIRTTDSCESHPKNARKKFIASFQNCASHEWCAINRWVGIIVEPAYQEKFERACLRINKRFFEPFEFPVPICFCVDKCIYGKRIGYWIKFSGDTDFSSRKQLNDLEKSLNKATKLFCKLFKEEYKGDAKNEIH